jgi:hypothetical protein
MARANYDADRNAVASCAIERVATPKVVVGVDVGEDYLDLAVLRAQSLAHYRIALRGIEDDPLPIVRAALGLLPGRRSPMACADRFSTLAARP